MPGAWSEEEDGYQGSETEECEATEVQQKVVQMIGQPAAGRTKAESSLSTSSDRRSQSENPKAVWARFYPKFHCELNYIHWVFLGCSKAMYSGELQLLICRTRTHSFCRIRVY